MKTPGTTVKRGLALGALMIAAPVSVIGPGAAAAAAPVEPVGATTREVSRASTTAASAAIELGSWMDQLSGTIGARPLNQIVIPGSHDAGTAGITKDSGVCDAGDTADVARQWPALAAGMSRTQSGSLVQQLNGGSRYLDLRLCKQNGTWYSYHGGPLGRRFFDSRNAAGEVTPGEARELADWIKAHPREIVILRVAATGPAATLAEDRRAAITALGDLVGGGPGHPAIADGSLGPTSTYDRFMAAGKHVIIVDDTNSTSYPWAWRQPNVQDYRGSYVGVSTAWQDILMASLDPDLAQDTFEAVLKRGDEVLGRAPGATADKFFVQQAIIDPTHSIPNAAFLQILATFRLTSPWKADNFLISLENDLNRQLLGKLRTGWNHTNVTDNMNIVMTDDVNQNRAGVGAGELQREIISKNLPQRVTSHTFYTSTRGPDGTWREPRPLLGTGNAFRFAGSRQAVAAMPDGSTQVLGVGLDGNIWHNVVGSDGGWQGWNALPAADNEHVGFAAEDITITGMPNGDSQVVAVGRDGFTYHNIRYAKGSWQGWAAMAGDDWGRLKASRVAAAGMPDGSTQVLVSGGDGRMRLSTRGADGNWNAWSPVPGMNTPDLTGSALSIAALPQGDSQVAIIGEDGTVWHTVRRADGRWTGWGRPAGVSGSAMGASEVSLIGMPNGDSHVAVVGDDGTVYHAVRHRAGDWTPFRPVPGIRGAGTFAGDRVGIAGLPDGSSRLLLTTR
ncbi:hypothetical protein [Streptomyces albidochromogenes]|uniref:Phosphatidylinositol diacylglycerol-lyase n=1 Tax=Streptomyces albidochromogenes TaxID=329524 RepID=A0ABW6FKH8_9ACTN